MTLRMALKIIRKRAPHTEETFQTLWDVAIHLGVDPEEFGNALPRKEGEPYFRQWEYLNTDFCHPNRW